MERNSLRVKGARPYDSILRRSQAESTRTVVLVAAERLFLSQGYAATTLAVIATAAGVSVETIYKSFGGKTGLVAAIRELRLAGSGAVHAERRSDAMRRRETDPRRIIARWGELTAEVAPLVSPILLLVRDAALIDTEMAVLRDRLDADRRRRMAVNARHLRSGGHLRSGVSLAKAVDVLWTYSSPELYELLVVRRGWSASRYGAFVAQGMVAALLP